MIENPNSQLREQCSHNLKAVQYLALRKTSQCNVLAENIPSYTVLQIDEIRVQLISTVKQICYQDKHATVNAIKKNTNSQLREQCAQNLKGVKWHCIKHLSEIDATFLVKIDTLNYTRVLANSNFHHTVLQIEEIRIQSISAVKKNMLSRQTHHRTP